MDKLGSVLSTVETYDDFECRGRNRIASAKLSEHGKGNAVNLRALKLADGRALSHTDVTVAKDFRDGLRESACYHFHNCARPGSDDYHEARIYPDLIKRSSRFDQASSRLPDVPMGRARAGNNRNRYPDPAADTAASNTGAAP